MVKMAVAQMCSGTVLEDNLATVELLAAEASSRGVQLLLLPENFALLDSKALIELAQSEAANNAVHNRLSSLARKYGLWLIAGSFPILSAEPSGSAKVFSRCWVFDASGTEVGQYDKIHLFDVDVEDGHAAYRESDFIAAGNTLSVVDSPWGRIGLSICYDLRFPEMYQKLRQMGADILMVPAAFTYVTGQAHWEVLLRARAIETQCFVLASDQGGWHSATRRSWGQSMLINPWGEVLAERKDESIGLAVAELDLTELHKRRQAMPVMQHRDKAGL